MTCSSIGWLRSAKVRTSADAAFAAPNGPGVPPVLPPADPAELCRQLDTLRPHLGQRAVLTVTAQPGRAEHHAAALHGAIERLGDSLGAIHLLGYGSGNVPAEAALAPILAAANERGVLIAIGTQVPTGAVDPATYASGAWLARAGAVGTGDMTVAAANAKLHLTLALAAARGWDPATQTRFFAGSLAGERTV